MLQEAVEQKERVAQSAWHHDAVEAGRAIADVVEISDAASTAEILRVRAGIDGSHRHDEPETVYRGDLAGAPGGDDRDFPLGFDESGIRPGERLVADVVLLHPRRPGAGECRIEGVHERLQPYVAGLGQKYGAHALVEIPRPRTATLGYVVELAGEAGTGVDLQQEVWQIHPRDHGTKSIPEFFQRGRLIQPVEP